MYLETENLLEKIGLLMKGGIDSWEHIFLVIPWFYLYLISIEEGYQGFLKVLGKNTLLKRCIGSEKEKRHLINQEFWTIEYILMPFLI